MEVVINDCYGGFDLSHEAVMRYGELVGVKIYSFVWGRDNKGSLDTDNLIPYNPVADKDPFLVHYYTSPEREEGTYFDTHNIKRTDPILIQVIKELGQSADSKFSELKVIDVPDDVEWAIEEYDGIEWIAEKHRVWR